ncbi:MAG TPA: glycine betaine ABC transporter substrate-binding protein [Solirubrobacterales bacterium]|nr:glycine betaine ABC transporter substrate-binding protein [Solirubrobacterales bacterium]
MSGQSRLKAAFAVLAAMVIALGVAACGGGDDNDTGTSGGNSANLIKSNSANSGVQLTVGSKNFTEALILGNIYAQALQAAGYNVKTNLNLGSETIAYKALQDGEISGYPEYTSTLLTSIFGKEANQVPAEAQAAYQQAQQQLQPNGETAFAPTPFADANALGMLKTKADELGVTTISDLQGKSQDLTLYGSPECRQRVDCLVGLQDVYGLQFKSFNPVDIGLRYTVLDKGQADLSILFTSDAQLAANPDKYVLLQDDKGIFPSGNVIWVTDQSTVQKAGPDYQATIEKVQQGLTLPVMQELNARVDIDKQEPAAVATQYLKEDGYIQ